MAIFGGGAAGGLVRVRCPKCHKVQARGRAEKRTAYSCTACSASFTIEEGQHADRLYAAEAAARPGRRG